MVWNFYNKTLFIDWRNNEIITQEGLIISDIMLNISFLWKDQCNAIANINEIHIKKIELNVRIFDLSFTFCQSMYHKIRWVIDPSWVKEMTGRDLLFMESKKMRKEWWSWISVHFTHNNFNGLFRKILSLTIDDFISMHHWMVCCCP